MYFLNSEECTQPLPSDPPATPTILPGAFLDSLGTSSELQVIYEKYFSSIHAWLPLLSPKVVRRIVQEETFRGDANHALLLMCIKLISQQRSKAGPVTDNIYSLVKELIMKLEITALPSLILLQSIILISTYESMQGIFPSAFYSVGHAVRLGTMMGLHDREHALQLFKDPGTWTRREEQRRAWWSVLLLDRFTNQELPSVPLSTPEPHSGELLPCSETAWDTGAVGINEPLYVPEFSANTTLGSFANACQAAHALGRALRHRDDRHTDVDIGFRVNEAKQLHTILSALTTHLYRNIGISMPDSSTMTALGLTFTARYLVYGLYACNERYSSGVRSTQETEMQQISLAGIYEVSHQIWTLTRRILDIAASGEAACKASPLLCHCLYLAAGECEWFVLEDSESDGRIWFLDIVELLRIMAERWQIAGIYVEEINKWPGYNQVRQ
ncbi:uncharacterized protein JN550_002917 [Neoarthrinium moseri]|uniref:uncharacterized protein n=1 Tax=Neoarthrinium moseri TaxID=1658444 RepID=UPI001FDCA3D5|nr:uncharacterized protein JN550_002917 [Neoarthrinium moseri]KAI1874338.1 hypothetical protein JN550_002917 [Neoarthrinium moseri]